MPFSSLFNSKKPEDENLVPPPSRFSTFVSSLFGAKGVEELVRPMYQSTFARMIDACIDVYLELAKDRLYGIGSDGENRAKQLRAECYSRPEEEWPDYIKDEIKTGLGSSFTLRVILLEVYLNFTDMDVTAKKVLSFASNYLKRTSTNSNPPSLKFKSTSLNAKEIEQYVEAIKENMWNFAIDRPIDSDEVTRFYKSCLGLEGDEVKNLVQTQIDNSKLSKEFRDGITALTLQSSLNVRNNKGY